MFAKKLLEKDKLKKKDRKLLKTIFQSGVQNRELEFFFTSMSDETYLDMIRDRIEFLIDEGYKFSEQLEIINGESGRNIRYKDYTNFVKHFVLEKPENLFQNREFHRYYRDYRGSEKKISGTEEEEAPKKVLPREEKIREFSPRSVEKVERVVNVAKATEDDFTRPTSVPPMKKPKVVFDRDDTLKFKHEAMPNVDELY
jgi:hypothetical protein